jgi:hypothetical protein
VKLRKQIIKWKKERAQIMKEQMQKIASNAYNGWINKRNPGLNHIEKFLRPVLKKRFTQLANQEEQKWRQRELGLNRGRGTRGISTG